MLLDISSINMHGCDGIWTDFIDCINQDCLKKVID